MRAARGALQQPAWQPPPRSGRPGTVSQFSKQAGYRVTYDDAGEDPAAVPHEDFGILEIRKLLVARAATELQ